MSKFFDLMYSARIAARQKKTMLEEKKVRWSVRKKMYRPILL